LRGTVAAAAPAIPLLVRAVMERIQGISSEASYALQSIGAAAIPPALVALREQPHVDTAYLVSGLHVPPELLQPLLNDPTPTVRYWALHVIWLSSEHRTWSRVTQDWLQPSLLSLVQPLLADPDGEVRAKAVETVHG